MRIVVMGTGGFVIPSFESLVESDHDVVAVVTKPPPSTRGRRKALPNLMRQAAQRHGMTILDPVSINEPAAIAAVADYRPDLLFVCDYGHILSARALEVARLGGINLHASLLPKYRGAAPINWAIYHGEHQTGVTVLHMTPRMDAGPSLVQSKVEIGATEDAVELEDRLSKIGSEAVRQAISMLREWDGQTQIGEMQDPKMATKAPRLQKADGRVNWNRSAAEIANQVRGLKPWPGTYSSLQRSGSEPLRIILEEVHAVDSPEGHGPGTIDPSTIDPSTIDPSTIVASTDELGVQTSDGVLMVTRVKPAGKRSMVAAEFLRGNTVREGMRFEP